MSVLLIEHKKTYDRYEQQSQISSVAIKIAEIIIYG